MDGLLKVVSVCEGCILRYLHMVACLSVSDGLVVSETELVATGDGVV